MGNFYSVLPSRCDISDDVHLLYDWTVKVTQRVRSKNATELLRGKWMRNLGG